MSNKHIQAAFLMLDRGPTAGKRQCLGKRYHEENTKNKIQNTKYKIQNTKYKIQNTKYKIQNTKYEIKCTTTKYTCVFGQYCQPPYWHLSYTHNIAHTL